MSVIEVFPGLSSAGYQRHALHGEDVVWVEKNCYADLWIELLHALGLEPLAILPFTLAVDFEGDQWTFFKPPGEDLRMLYGIDVQELTVWRPLIEHAQEHLRAGKLIATEADAYWLPDTAGTDYRSKHSKTTIVLANLDVEARTLGYFHNAGFYELEGEDFAQLFALDSVNDTRPLPLFAEWVRIDRLQQRAPPDLAAQAWGMLYRHAAWRPSRNPFERFADRFATDLPLLQAAGLAHYHAWAFASVRQAGSAFDLAAAHLRWQAGWGHPELLAPALCFEAIAQSNKALILKGARAVNSGKPLDAKPLFTQMIRAWDEGMALLDKALGRDPTAAL